VQLLKCLDPNFQFLKLRFYFFSPFFLWLYAGWFTLHCLRNRVYFLLFFTSHISFTLDFFAATLHLHMCIKAQLDFYPQVVSFNVSIKSLFSIETIQLKSVKVLKSWKISTQKTLLVPGIELQLPIMSLMNILLNNIDENVKSEIGRSWEGLRLNPLGFHVKGAADAKLIQHGLLGVAFHNILTVPVTRNTEHAMVPSYYFLKS